jgi:hypothetical protein
VPVRDEAETEQRTTESAGDEPRERGPDSEHDVATRVVLSYPADLSTWGRDIVEDDPFRAYLPKAHENATPGDRWEEFVGVGCCGSAMDVPLHVEAVEGGSRVTRETTIEFTVREACDVGGWAVQSDAGPE